jgi:hypothetical protein
MAGQFGEDFDPSQPAGNSPASRGDDAIRDIKQRLKNFINQFFNSGGDTFKEGIIPGAALENVTGLSAGEFNLLTVDTKGRVVAARKVTTLADLGVEFSDNSVRGAKYGGTGLDASAAGNGTLLIGKGDGFSLATLTPGNGIKITNGAGTISIDVNLSAYSWHARVILPSATAQTAVDLFPDESVPAGKKLIVTGFIAKVNGATAWGTATEVDLRGTDGLQFASIPVASLTAGAIIHSAGTTLADAFALGTGGAAGKGLQIKADANATGSDLSFAAWGVLVDA